MANEVATISNTGEPDVPLIVVSLIHILKLTPTNYIAWKTQIEATLIGYDLYKFIDGSDPAPPQTITTTIPAKPATDTSAAQPATTTIKPNPTYQTWYRQDKLILAALAGTLSPDLVPLISQNTTTLTAWNTLTKTYANPSKSHIKQLKDRLCHIVKGPRSITEYMRDIKSCADQLHSLGRPVDADDLIDRILEQLNDPEFDTVVHAIQNRENPITFDELHEKLINRELSIQQKNRTPPPFPASVNYSSKPNHYNPRPPPNNNISNNRQPYRGTCQWCRTPGHSVPQCPTFRAQNPNATMPTTSRFPPPRTGNYNPRPNNPNNNTYNYSNNYNNNNPTRPNHSIHAATTAAYNSPQPWLFDTGATHHVTKDLENLSLHCPYNDTEELFIRDGSGLPIENTGSTSLLTSSSTFKLNHVLHVPSLSRNIISISKLCHDNNAFVTFSSNYFCVKENQTGKILL